MKYVKFAALAAVVGASSVHAASVTTSTPIQSSSVGVLADCDPARTNGGLQSGTSASCSDFGDAAVISEVNVSNNVIRAGVSTGPSIFSDGLFLAAATIRDTTVVTPDDASLIGTTGTVSFDFLLDGFLGGDSDFIFTMAALVPNSNGSRTLIGGTHDFSTSFGTSAPTSGSSNALRLSSPGEGSFFETALQVSFDVTFGEVLNYSIGLTANAEGANSTADLLNTVELLDVTSTDEFGNAVALTLFDSAGGVLGLNNVVTTPAPNPVPLPAGMPLLICGLTALGLVRRRNRAA